MNAPGTTRGQVIIVGAGIVGIGAAHALLDDGWQVTLLERHLPARGASYGNAGAFAVSDIIPLSSPGSIRQVPGWLLDPCGPLAVRWRHLPTLAPWLWRFVRAGHPTRVRTLTRAMAALLGRVDADYAPLIAAAGLTPMWRRRGALTLYPSLRARDADAAAWRSRRSFGIRCIEVAGKELAQLEPGLSAPWHQAVRVPAWSHVDDPYRFATGLHAAALARGARSVQATVDRIDHEHGRVRGVVLDDGQRIAADAVVIAAGIDSDRFTRQLGLRVPLESERGYHVTLPQAGIELNHFLQPAGEGFVILPMGDGAIRLAGTVELASRDAPENWARAGVLIDKARRILPPFSTDGMSQWMGNRPSLPDTLPIIGAAPGVDRLLFATGHGHLGLTLAATTGRLLADLLAGRDSGIDLAPYAPTRF